MIFSVLCWFITYINPCCVTFCLDRSKHENISVYSYEKQSAEFGNVEIVIYAGLLSQEMMQVHFPKI